MGVTVLLGTGRELFFSVVVDVVHEEHLELGFCPVRHCTAYLKIPSRRNGVFRIVERIELSSLVLRRMRRDMGANFVA